MAELDLAALAVAVSRAPNQALTPRRASTGIIQMTTGTWYSVVNVTGAGWLLGLGGYLASGSSISNLQIRVTIDGKTPVVMSGALILGAPYVTGSTWNTTDAYVPLSPPVRFKSSLLVEVTQSGGGFWNARGEAFYHI